MNKQEFYASLPEELKEKLKACKTGEEMKALLKGAQIELPDELLEAVSGGGPYGCWGDTTYLCSTNVYTPPCNDNTGVEREH